MEEPLSDLLNTLEVSLTNLLQRVNNDPWSLLIIQTLLWSFRRWAIHYLMSTEMDGCMKDYVWDSHLELVRDFAPDGLKEFGIIWLNPTNVGDRVDILEELNAYFLCMVDNLDRVLENDNDDDQNTFAIFLDETITDIVSKWLDGREEYRIYPKSDTSPDTFENGKIFTIMQLILEAHIKPSFEKPPVEQAVVQEPTVQEPTVEQPPVEQPPVEEPAPTIATALRRRRTMRSKARRIRSEKGTRKHKTLH